VSVCEDAWPVIASADDEWFEGEFEFQANRKTRWFIRARQHDDGRAIVYGGYSHVTHWRNESNQHARHGVTLPAGSDTAAVCEAIREVCQSLANDPQCPDDGRWETLANRCQAGMPAEEID